MNIVSILPFFVAIPLFAAFLISLLGKKVKGIADAAGNIAALSLFVCSLFAAFFSSLESPLIYKIGGWIPPYGISFVLDSLSAFMLIVINLVALLVSIFSVDYMKKFTSKWKFYTLFMLMLAGMNGVVITGDLFNLFVFLEIASIASYALVAFGTERHELEAAFKYAVMGTVASLFILLGIVFLYSYTSTLNMADMAIVISQNGPSKIILLVSAIFIMGFGLKSALIPFHAWLPDAHPSAPAPISALLSGILIKSLGIYAICRIFYNVLGMTSAFSSILMFLGAISMVIGAILAIGQWDFKRLLAYSSISQVGYIVLGIGLNTPLGIMGGLFHLFNHSLFKSLLFLNSGAVEYATGTRDMRQMGGLAEKLPVTRNTNIIASMSIAGIPPFGGFFSKLIIIIACVEAGHNQYALCAVLVSILTLAMYLKVLKNVFFGELSAKLTQIKKIPFFMKISMTMLAFLCLISGLLLIKPAKEVFLEKAAKVLYDGSDYKQIISKGLK
ncbi:MAG: monovalent cation/H+ antiporter subunit D family protein [Candidatus Omnitrophota bacterium]